MGRPPLPSGRTARSGSSSSRAARSRPESGSATTTAAPGWCPRPGARVPRRDRLVDTCLDTRRRVARGCTRLVDGHRADLPFGDQDTGETRTRSAPDPGREPRRGEPGDRGDSQEQRPGAAKSTRACLSGMFGLAIQDGAVAVNPVRDSVAKISFNGSNGFCRGCLAGACTDQHRCCAHKGSASLRFCAY